MSVVIQEVNYPSSLLLLLTSVSSVLEQPWSSLILLTFFFSLAAFCKLLYLLEG